MTRKNHDINIKWFYILKFFNIIYYINRLKNAIASPQVAKSGDDIKLTTPSL